MSIVVLLSIIVLQKSSKRSLTLLGRPKLTEKNFDSVLFDRFNSLRHNDLFCSYSLGFIYTPVFTTSWGNWYHSIVQSLNNLTVDFSTKVSLSSYHELEILETAVQLIPGQLTFQRMIGWSYGRTDTIKKIVHF